MQAVEGTSGRPWIDQKPALHTICLQLANMMSTLALRLSG